MGFDARIGEVFGVLRFRVAGTVAVSTIINIHGRYGGYGESFITSSPGDWQTFHLDEQDKLIVRSTVLEDLAEKATWKKHKVHVALSGYAFFTEEGSYKFTEEIISDYTFNDWKKVLTMDLDPEFKWYLSKALDNMKGKDSVNVYGDDF